MIAREEIEKLAVLARLKLDEAELQSLQLDISTILTYVGQLQQFEVAAGAASTVPVVHNVLRADKPRAAGDLMASKEALLREAFPTEERGYNVVRKIIQKDE